MPNVDPVEKISIVRRGHALGITWIASSEDKYLYSKAKFLDEVISLLWWRAAEELFFGRENITTGAASDFEKATEIITNMLVKYGMDDDLWTVMYLDKDKNEYSMFRNYSEKTAQIIDEKIKSYMQSCFEKSKDIVKQHKALIEKMSVVLLDKEYLTREEFESMMSELTKKSKK